MPRGKNSSDKFIKRLLVAGLFLIVFGILISINVSVFGPGKPYYAIQFNNGDLVFGKISYFPRLVARDVYVIQQVQAQDGSSNSLFQVIPISENTVWEPNSLILSWDSIQYISRVGEYSQLMQAIKGASSQ